MKCDICESVFPLRCCTVNISYLKETVTALCWESFHDWNLVKSPAQSSGHWIQVKLLRTACSNNKAIILIVHSKVPWSLSTFWSVFFFAFPSLSDIFHVPHVGVTPSSCLTLISSLNIINLCHLLLLFHFCWPLWLAVPSYCLFCHCLCVW